MSVNKGQHVSDFLDISCSIVLDFFALEFQIEKNKDLLFQDRENFISIDFIFIKIDLDLLLQTDCIYRVCQVKLEETKHLFQTENMQ